MKKLLTFVFVLAYFLVPTMANGQMTFWLPGHVGLYGPQLVIGGGYRTDVTITNVSSTPTQVVLSFGMQDGSTLLVKLTDARFPQLFWNSTGYNPGGIPPGGSVQVTLTSPSLTPVVGSLGAIITRSVSGQNAVQVSMQYSYAPYGTVLGQAAVSVAEPSMGFGFHAVRSIEPDQDELRTGVAITNTTGRTANLTFRVRNRMGQEVASFPLTIVPYGQIAKFLGEMTTLPANWSGGLVEVTSDVPIAGMTLQTTLNMEGTFIFSTGTTFPLPQN